MYWSSWLLWFFFLLVFSWCPQKSALVVKKLSTMSRLRRKLLLDQLFFIVRRKKNMTTVDYQSKLISGNPFVNQCKDKRGDDGCRFTGFVSICTVSPVFLVCPQTHTKVYLYRWEYECWDVCLCVSVVYCKRRLESATPCSRCRAEAAVLAQEGLCCRPAGRAARRACCTAGKLSSPPTT